MALLLFFTPLGFVLFYKLILFSKIENVNIIISILEIF